jgi:hypothetical protein
MFLQIGRLVPPSSGVIVTSTRGRWAGKRTAIGAALVAASPCGHGVLFARDRINQAERRRPP